MQVADQSRRSEEESHIIDSASRREEKISTSSEGEKMFCFGVVPSVPSISRDSEERQQPRPLVVRACLLFPFLKSVYDSQQGRASFRGVSGSALVRVPDPASRMKLAPGLGLSRESEEDTVTPDRRSTTGTW